MCEARRSNATDPSSGEACNKISLPLEITETSNCCKFDLAFASVNDNDDEEDDADDDDDEEEEGVNVDCDCAAARTEALLLLLRTSAAKSTIECMEGGRHFSAVGSKSLIAR